MTTAWYQIALLFIQFALMAACVYLTWRALFADRPRGRRRCPRCWYDLSWTTGLLCPECGFHGRHERDVLRTRRRSARAALYITAAASVGLWSADRVMQRGWASYFPDRLLVAMVSFDASTADSLIVELDQRMRRRQLSDSAWFALLQRSAKGAPDARPASPAWTSICGEFTRRAAFHLLNRSDAPWAEPTREVLYELACKGDPEITLRARTPWPVGIAPTLDVNIADWIAIPAEIRITLTPDLPGAVPDVHIKRRLAIQPRSYSLTLPELPTGEHEIQIETQVERRIDARHDWQLAGSSTITVPLTVSGAPLEPVVGPALDSVMLSAFAGGLVKYASGSLPVRVRVGQNLTQIAAFDDIAVGVQVEVRRNDVPVRRLDIWWCAGTNVPAIGRQNAWEVPMINDALMSPPLTDADVWTVVVTSNPLLANRVEGPTRYWSGTVQTEVQVRELRGAAPSRGWTGE